MIKFKIIEKEVVKGVSITPDTTKEEQDIFKTTDPIDMAIPEKEEAKEIKKKGRKKKNVW